MHTVLKRKYQNAGRPRRKKYSKKYSFTVNDLIQIMSHVINNLKLNFLWKTLSVF